MRISDWSSDVCSSGRLHRLYSIQRNSARRHPARARKRRARASPRDGLDGLSASRNHRWVRIDHADVHGPSARRVISKIQFVDISGRSEEHTSELQSLMRISYAVFCLKKKK